MVALLEPEIGPLVRSRSSTMVWAPGLSCWLTRASLGSSGTPRSRGRDAGIPIDLKLEREVMDWAA